MKKTIEFILTATAALSVALAGSAAQISGTDFESMNLDAAVQYNAPDTQGVGASSYWYTEAGYAGSSVTNGVVVSNAVPVDCSAGYPNQYTNSTHSQYLQLSTAEELKRTINASGVNGITPYSMAEEGKETLYVDMLVKFTPSDIAPATNETDKLVVWMNSESNIVVRAGYYDYSFNLVKYDYVMDDCGIKPDVWHRLTIRTYAQPPETELPLFFTVQIDGTNQTYASLNMKICDDMYSSLMDGTGEETIITEPCVNAFNSNSLFVSPVPGNTTISYVSFTGVGSVDDISFTHEEPVFAGGGETLHFAPRPDWSSPLTWKLAFSTPALLSAARSSMPVPSEARLSPETSTGRSMLTRRSSSMRASTPSLSTGTPLNCSESSGSIVTTIRSPFFGTPRLLENWEFFSRT